MPVIRRTISLMTGHAPAPELVRTTISGSPTEPAAALQIAHPCVEPIQDGWRDVHVRLPSVDGSLTRRMKSNPSICDQQVCGGLDGAGVVGARMIS